MSVEAHQFPQNKENTIISEKMSASQLKNNDRRSLKTLQISADGKLIGTERNNLKSKISTTKQPLKIFQDRKSDSSSPRMRDVDIQTFFEWRDKEVQTEETDVFTRTRHDLHNDSGVGAFDIDQEAYDLMVRDPIPENYWQELAEQRRLALAEALSENEMLNQSIESLKEENQNLSLLAGQAEHLASVLDGILGSDNKEEESCDKGDNSEQTSEERTEEDRKDEEDEQDNNKASHPTEDPTVQPASDDNTV